MKTSIAIVCAALIAGAAPSAAAQTTASITATGRAEAADATPSRSARQVAIDRAFADAINQQLARELTTTERRRGRDVLQREIVRRARLYVRSFKVVSEASEDGRLVVTIRAAVDQDKLRGKLAELGIDGAGARPAPSLPTGSRPPLVVILHASRGEVVDTTFGARGGPGGPAGVALAAQFDALGFALASAAGSEAPTSTDAGASLPVGDSAAVELARRVGAGGAVVVGIDVTGDGPIRSTSLRGAAGTGTVRVIDAATGAVVARGRVDAAGFGDSERAAVDTAAATLGRLVADDVAGAVTRHWPSAVATPDDGRIVVVRGAARWPSVTAVMARLRRVPGTRGVAIRRLQAGTVALVVGTSLTPAQLVRQLRGVALPLGTASVRVAGDRVDVIIDGDAAGGD